MGEFKLELAADEDLERLVLLVVHMHTPEVAVHEPSSLIDSQALEFELKSCDVLDSVTTDVHDSASNDQLHQALEALLRKPLEHMSASHTSTRVRFVLSSAWHNTTQM